MTYRVPVRAEQRQQPNRRDIMRRRNIMLGAIGAAAATHALGQGSYPDRPIALVHGYAPGGLSDVISRMAAEPMQRVLGRPLVVESRPGGATAVASTYVAQARPDGYTLLVGTSSLAINPTLQPSLTPRDPVSAFMPVGPICYSPQVLLVKSALPVTTVQEFIGYAKARPGQLNFANSGNGSVNHLIAVMFNRALGIAASNVPYRGATPSLTDLRAGRVDATFATFQDAQALIRDGSARALAISSRDRIPQLPEVPAVAELLPGFHSVFWLGLFAPAGVPEAIVARLAEALQAAKSDPLLQERTDAGGMVLVPGGPEAMATMLRSETESWGRLIREAEIKPD
jgi:tripartite-type tricarboxylate transporter receptor subunit TctC